MTGPKRVRVPGAFKFKQLPEGTVYVGRATFGYPASPYGNPHPIGRCRMCAGVEHTRGAALIGYRRWLDEHPELVERARVELAGKDLACWCAEFEACHADILLALVNDGPADG